MSDKSRNEEVLKILTFSNCPLVETQGSGYVIVNFGRRFRDRGHTVEQWGPDACEPFRLFRKARFHRLSLGIALRALWRVLRHDYDVIEFYGAESWLATSLLSLLRNRRFLIVQHSNGLECVAAEKTTEHFTDHGLDRPAAKWYQRVIWVPLERAFTEADSLVTVSQNELEYARARSYQPPDRLLGIPNALPDEFLGLPLNLERKKQVCYCGAWLPEKGRQTIVADMVRILEEFTEWHFKLIGVMEDFRKEAYFPAAICERIEVVPFVECKLELREHYQEAAVSIAPSLYESFGLVVAEAMACGCAVVATETGFAAHLHNREEVLLMQRPCPPHLYNCLKELIENEEFRRSLARAGHLRVQNLRWKDSVDALEKHYMKCLQDFRAQRGVESLRRR